VRRMSGVRPLAELPEPEIELIDEISRKGYRIQKWYCERTRNHLARLGLHSAARHERALLYLHEGGKEADAAVGGRSRN